MRKKQDWKVVEYKMWKVTEPLKMAINSAMKLIGHTPLNQMCQKSWHCQKYWVMTIYSSVKKLKLLGTKCEKWLNYEKLKA